MKTPNLQVLKTFHPPKGVHFGVKTAVSQVAFYPVFADKKRQVLIVEKMQMNFTLEITVRLNDYQLPKMKKIVRKIIETEEMEALFNHLNNQL